MCSLFYPLFQDARNAHQQASRKNFQGGEDHTSTIASTAAADGQLEQDGGDVCRVEDELWFSLHDTRVCRVEDSVYEDFQGEEVHTSSTNTAVADEQLENGGGVCRVEDELWFSLHDTRMCRVEDSVYEDF